MSTIITPKNGEKVYFTIRKSLFRLVKPFLKVILLYLFSIFVLIYSPNEIFTIIAIVVLLFALSYTFYYFLLWFYDVYIITNQRVICVEQKSLFSKEFAEIDLADIKDVTYAIKGVAATLFRYGTVKIKSEDGTLELEGLSEPDEVQEMLKKLSENNRKTSKGDTLSANELVEFIMKNHKK
jgi:uncharacterized membrane protein YdbT with pleckstrin-like domain